jgi:hypothetical protein
VAVGRLPAGRITVRSRTDELIPTTGGLLVATMDTIIGIIIKMADHPILMLTWINFIIVWIIVFFAGYYLVHGRRIDKVMMGFNLFTALLALTFYGLFFIDAYWVDFLTKVEVSRYIIKPLILTLLCALLANILRIGRRKQ